MFFYRIYNEMGLLKDFFINETYGLNGWLAKEENLLSLSKEIGLSLSNPKKEMRVGNYYCDIYCQDDKDNPVIIECQMGKTDHEHLGKMLTYACLLKCNTMVWVCASVDDGHIATSRWLMTLNNTIKIYIVKLLLYGRFNPKIIFQCVERPLQYGNIYRKIEQDTIIQARRKARNPFWEYLQSFMTTNNFFPKRILDENEMLNINIGSSIFHISVTISIEHKKIGINFFVRYNENVSKNILNKIKKYDREISKLMEKEMSLIEFKKSGTFYYGFWLEHFDITNDCCYDFFALSIVKNINAFLKILADYDIINASSLK